MHSCALFHKESNDFMPYIPDNAKNETFFSVPESVAEDHIRVATGEQLKVLLLILSNPKKYSSPAAVAKKLKTDGTAAEDCIKYWLLTGVLKEESAENDKKAKEPEKFVPSQNKKEPEKFVPSSADNKEQKSDSSSDKSEDKKDDSVQKTEKIDPASIYFMMQHSEISSRIDESPDLSALLCELQARMGKTIAHEGLSVFLMLYDYYGLPADVIYMLTDYCVKIGKGNYNYIKAVGQDWGMQEIDTIEKAAEKIQTLSEIDKIWNKFSVETGLKNPKPTSSQKKYFEKWLFTLKMDYALLVTAYEMTAEKTGKVSMSYMDKIIENWNAKGIKTAKDLEVEEANRSDAAAAKSDGSASYDLDKFREKSKNKKLKYERKN